MAYILGLTGGIASGKSTVSQIFKEKEIPVVDADVGAREVVKPGKPALKKIKEAFGDEVFLEDGTLNRPALGKIIFKDKVKRQQLNECIRGDIRQWIKEERDRYIEEGYPFIVLDVPLLYEAEYEKEVDAVMVVAVDEQTQAERLMKRNDLSKDEAKERIVAQMPLKEKVNRADTVIDNNGSLEQTSEQVVSWMKENAYLKA